ncbi:hypothetical protein ONR49_26465, partial [Salmonella enterica subsp. enterica serovar Virginia]|nr:hypothetical protein [Salmonella enterica subsp. enterica serovar Virginia]
NGLRQGLLDAMREFCEYRNILPRGVKLSAEDIWDRCAYVLSVSNSPPSGSHNSAQSTASVSPLKLPINGFSGSVGRPFTAS